MNVSRGRLGTVAVLSVTGGNGPLVSAMDGILSMNQSMRTVYSQASNEVIM